MPETKKYLNRDGLEEYNSLLPHSSAEIQEYVDDWLDAHPEATTTVQDGSITTQKLADGSVTRNKLAADVAHLLGGMMVTGEVQGEILSADDAYSVAPLSMSIDGKSTQNGTPTPDAPVPIESIEVLELPVTFAGKNLISDNPEDYFHSYIYYLFDVPAIPNATYTYSRKSGIGNEIGFVMAGKDSETNPDRDIVTLTYRDRWTFTNTEGFKIFRFRIHQNGVNTIKNKNLQFELGHTATEYTPYVTPIIANIPMQGHVLRSLPDGTCDTMSLSYLRESDRSGWAWYSRELVQKLHEITLNTCVWLLYSTTAFYTRGLNLPYTQGAVEVLCNIFKASASKNLGGLANAEINSIQVLGRNELGIKTASEYQDVSAFVASLDDSDVAVAKLATPITTQLDPIELPVLPAPNCTVWADPTTGLRMEYVRDSNIVIQRIEEAIADL